MDHNVPSTAGRRQFNDTALAKLLAEGVPRAVALAFINHGIDKSGRYPTLRDHVCKMEYVRYLLPRTAEDYKNPMRVGQLAPYVVEQKAQRFFTEFAMSDVEAARFGSHFPEFTVIPRGTTYNQHGFYANKRYAEAELLVSMVYQHARKHGVDWDPTSLVDVGGNEVWHAKRDRAHVHCDNPVLSARDVARYTTRQVFSGATGSTTCNKKFSECTVRAQYGIAVHSSYDFSPKGLAFGMCKRGMRVFFLVINVIPGLAKMAPGQYEVDGVVVTLHRPARAQPYVAYTFKHDMSLEYKHPLSVHQAYMNTRSVYHITKPTGEVVVYQYRVLSVRGNSLVATMEEMDGEIASVGSSLYAGPARNIYRLSVKLLDVSDLEVDAEFFDRLVYIAAGARGAENYDIVSLYRYAKSLRQRVSINGVVLSSGYTMVPEHLVTSVVCAYAVAAAFRTESVEFFKEASGQLLSKRGQGYLRDILRIAVGAFADLFGALASVLGAVSFYTKADRKLKTMIASRGAVEVCIDKPHAGMGIEYQPEMLSKPPSVGDHGKVKLAVGGSGSWLTPLAPGGWDAELVPSAVNCAGKELVFLSYSVPRLDDRELLQPSKPQYYDLSGFSCPDTIKSEEYRAGVYAFALKRIVGTGAFDEVPLVLPIGDRLYRKRMRPMDGEVSLTTGNRLVSEADTYVVFRGVGNKAVSLKPPECYSKGTCLRFVLFYVDEVATRVAAARTGKQIGVQSTDIARAVKKLVAGTVEAHGLEPVVGAIELSGSSDAASDTEWEPVSPHTVLRKVVSFEEHGSNPSYVTDMMEEGKFYMTGALSGDTPPVSNASSDTLVYTTRHGNLAPVPEDEVPSEPPGLVPPIGAATTVRRGFHRRTESDDSVMAVHAEARLFEESDGDDDSSGGRGSGGSTNPGQDPEVSVSSSDVVWGRQAIMEQLACCDAARDVALASSAEIIDLAVGVARGEAPVSMWGAAVGEGKQGSPVPVEVKGNCYRNPLTKEILTHMAVSDGVEVYDRVCNPPPDGLYVTSDIMAVYTGAAIRRSIAATLDNRFQCSVTNVNGVAGCGKTYTITHEARPGDVVLCETGGALEETRAKLRAQCAGWDDAAWTVDAFLCHVPRKVCNVLWIDESLRLHSAKIFAVVKMLEPVAVYCFGDNKQIPILPFIPGFDFVFAEFPFTSVAVKRDTRRSPADVCFITSHSRYYGFHVRTYNPVMRSIKGPELYRAGVLHAKAPGVVVLTYTQVAKEDLLAAGVVNVMTIGESQGGTFDRVMLYRDSMLGKPLYYDLGQTLVALTRHRKEFTYVTVAVNDDSAAAVAIRYLREKATALLIAAHSMVSMGESPVIRRASFGDDHESSGISSGFVSDWADDVSDH